MVISKKLFNILSPFRPFYDDFIIFHTYNKLFTASPV